MGLIPQFKLTANSADITATIKSRLISLRFTDAAGVDSDVLEITLSDNDLLNPIAIPPTGAELELFLGYDGAATRMGLFVTDEIELSGWPGTMTIRAHAAPFLNSKGGKSNLQTQKTRSWAKGTTLGAVVKKIASEHGMAGMVASSLSSIALPHLDQTDESDMHFLLRVAKKYDAVLKPADGKLVLAKRGETKSVSGGQITAVILAPEDVTSWHMTMGKREDSGSVVATYHDRAKAKRKIVTVGTGEPVTRLRMQHATQAMALSAAKAEMSKRARAKTTLAVVLPGRAELGAEAPLTLTAFRPGVDREWIITKVEHHMDNSGYICHVDAELPNDTSQNNVTETEE